MRILHILDHSLPLHSGYAFRTESILRAQRAAGWQTLQLTSPKQGVGPARQEEIDGFRYLRTPAARSPLDAWTAFNALGVMRALRRRIEQVIRDDSPDLLHAHSPVLNALPAIGAGRRHGLPVLYEMRANWEDAAVDHGTAKAGGLRYRVSRALETRALRRADAVTTICEGLRRDIVARGIAADRVTVIPNAVDLSRFGGRGRHQERLAVDGLDGARPLLGFIGSFYGYEGLDVLIEAMAGLAARLPTARLLLVGGGPAEAKLKDLVAARGLADKVVFAGRVPHDQVERYYELFDLLVYPRHSIRLTEMVTPLKPLEAMAKRQVVLASDVGGHRELIRHGETGFLFPPGDSEALAALILELQAAPERLADIAAAGRRFVEQERTWERSVSRYEPVYRALLGEARAARSRL